MYRDMDIWDCVADNVTHYIDIAVAIGTNRRSVSCVWRRRHNQTISSLLPLCIKKYCVCLYESPSLHSLRQDLHNRILERSNRIFEDEKAVSEWSEFLVSAAVGAPLSG